MSQACNPYEKLLHIAVHGRRPNDWELLGVAPAESDLQRIENAYHQRLAQLKDFEIGTYADETQQLIEEVSKAYQRLTSGQPQDTGPQSNLSAAPTKPPADSTVVERESVDERPGVPASLPARPTDAAREWLPHTRPSAVVPVVATCRRCGRTFQATASALDWQARCPACRATVVVPDPAVVSWRPTVEELAEMSDPWATGIASGSVGSAPRLPLSLRRASPQTRSPPRDYLHRYWFLLAALAAAGGGVLLLLVAWCMQRPDNPPGHAGPRIEDRPPPAAVDFAKTQAEAALARRFEEARQSWVAALTTADDETLRGYASAPFTVAQERALAAEREASAGKMDRATALYGEAVDAMRRARLAASDRLVTQCRNDIETGDRQAAQATLARLRGLLDSQDLRLGELGKAVRLLSAPLAMTPLDEQQAQQLQQSLAEYLSSPVRVSSSMGIELVLIPAGEFLMGASQSDSAASSSERPQHSVRISKPFYMGTHEVTVAQFRRFIKSTGYDAGTKWQNASPAQTDEHPVVNVNWDDAVAFLAWVGVQDGRLYRLPTEAEWEYACRAGTQSRFGFGDDVRDLEHYAWYSTNASGTTQPVGQKKPNAWGLVDIHGNVWEWCDDWYGSYGSGRVTDPRGASFGSSRILRGGSYANTPAQCRSTARDGAPPDTDNVLNSGFRAAWTP